MAEIPLRTMALLEIESQQETFSSMTQTCFNKCFSVMNQPGLSPGEADCVDRCISKYLATTTEIMQKMQAKNMSEQQELEKQVQQSNEARGGLFGRKERR